uniref:BRCT domain-containing protein n=1 Tax=Ciona savignyi TaxID=51511 RepID=H2Y6A5_CIOSA
MKYQQWQNRSGPENPGSKEIPQGQKNCMEGLTFVITGVQESLTRDEIKSLVERYGGKVTGSVSGRTSYLITGKEAGESKLNKAAQLKTKVIDEDEFLGLIRTLKGKKSKYDVSDDPPRNTRTPKKETIKKEPSNSKPSPPKPKDIKVKKEFPSEVTSSRPSSQDSVGSLPASQRLVAGGDSDQLMWVDKYKPKSVKHIIGQQGPNSNLNKLLKWLRNWHHNHRTAAGKSKPKPKINQWGGGDPTGGSLKAALLSGPPGVGRNNDSDVSLPGVGIVVRGAECIGPTEQAIPEGGRRHVCAEHNHFRHICCQALPLANEPRDDNG